MQRTIAITGAASGNGRATADYLRRQGRRVIGIDLRDADVTADLSKPESRRAMAGRVAALCRDGIDAVICVAGVSAPAQAPAPLL